MNNNFLNDNARVASETPDQSVSTQILVSLLARWHRRHIYQALFSDGASVIEAKAELLEGSVENSLAGLGAARPRKRKLDFGAEPAIGWFDAQYPEVLRHIPDPPLVLYWQGDTELLVRPMVAVVGARRCTAPGRQFARQLGADLSQAGVTVVSGMAEGVDAAAHVGALDHGAGSVAVLGSGLGRMYPRHHARLLSRALQAGGLVLSEYPHTTAPHAWQFPERNRIVSGLSCATVVVEASERSGSLITARLALEQGRDVFAVPGPVGSQVSSGCHRLIQQGAALILSAQDILQELGIDLSELPQQRSRSTTLLSDSGQKLLQLFSGQFLSAEELLRQSGLSEAEVSTELVLLELQGFVRREADGYIATP